VREEAVVADRRTEAGQHVQRSEHGHVDPRERDAPETGGDDDQAERRDHDREQRDHLARACRALPDRCNLDIGRGELDGLRHHLSSSGLVSSETPLR
jgi:hypothetical protein